MTCAVNNDKTRAVPTRRHYQYMIMYLEISRSIMKRVNNEAAKESILSKAVMGKVVKKKETNEENKSVFLSHRTHRTQRVKRVKEEEEEEREDFDEI